MFIQCIGFHISHEIHNVTCLITITLQSVGVWFCDDKNCRITVAGGAWNYSTTAAASVRSAVKRLKEQADA